MSPRRFLRKTPWRSAEDERETSPAARSTSDHPSCVQCIVKMAPQPPAVTALAQKTERVQPTHNRVRRQSYRLRNNWEGCHLLAMEPAIGTADTSPTLLHTDSTNTEKFHNNLGTINTLDSLPIEVKTSNPGRPVSSYSCSVHSEQKQEKLVLEADENVNLSTERICQCRLKLSKEEHQPEEPRTRRLPWKVVCDN